MVDDAAYHSVRLDQALTASSRERAMTDRFSDHGIPFSDRMCKPEFHFLTKMRKPRFNRFKIDALLAEHSHFVLHLLRYHTDLTPTEQIYGSVKEYVARKNVSFRLDDTMKLAEEKFRIITKKEWSSRCNNARQKELNCLLSN
jgi:hypothetical protein